MKAFRRRLAAAMLVVGLFPALAAAEDGVVSATPVAPADSVEAAGPATAASDLSSLSPESDRLLWCASAFYWLAGSAEDSGETEEAEMYDGWSAELVALAGRELTALGHTPESIESLIAHYDAIALDELGSADARHDIVACADLAAE